MFFLKDGLLSIVLKVLGEIILLLFILYFKERRNFSKLVVEVVYLLCVLVFFMVYFLYCGGILFLLGNIDFIIFGW